jgi:hypothetical protein
VNDDNEEIIPVDLDQAHVYRASGHDSILIGLDFSNDALFVPMISNGYRFLLKTSFWAAVYQAAPKNIVDKRCE